jgi:hypothetical protein
VRPKLVTSVVRGSHQILVIYLSETPKSTAALRMNAVISAVLRGSQANSSSGMRARSAGTTVPHAGAQGQPGGADILAAVARVHGLAPLVRQRFQ